MKLGRNDLCLCGSGKKYKKCCLKLGISYDNNLEKSVEEYMRGMFSYTSESEKVLYTPSYKTLDEDVVNQINNYIKEKEIIKRGCWYNSFNLSIEIDGVESIQGWYGCDISDSTINTILDLINFYKVNNRMNELIKGVYRPGKGFVRYDLQNNQLHKSKYNLTDNFNNTSVHIYDLNDKIEWMRHSWNSYNGVHFDLTKEVELDVKGKENLNEKDMFRDWTYYKKVRTVDTGSIKNNELLMDGFSKNFDEFKTQMVTIGSFENVQMTFS